MPPEGEKARAKGSRPSQSSTTASKGGGLFTHYPGDPERLQAAVFKKAVIEFPTHLNPIPDLETLTADPVERVVYQCTSVDADDRSAEVK